MKRRSTRLSLSSALPVGALLALAGCGAPQTANRSADDPAPVPTATVAGASEPAATADATPIPAATTAAVSVPTDGPLTCSAEIGASAAAARVAVCRNVSPATHPPCNAANSCAMIEDEIARSCALFDGKGPPMKGCGPDPKSAEAAADVVRRYYAAINARDYGTAWTQWGDDGQPGQTLAGFTRGFADTRSTRVSIGRLSPGDAGAGSSYQPVPVTVEATLADGRRQRFVGTYVVRRVNGIDGATASQLRWHIDSAKLRPVAG